MADLRCLLPTKITLFGGMLVVAGFLLSAISWWFLLLSAVGMFGPGFLREMGWLRDKDEFQLQAIHRAGYHAFLTTGILAIALAAFFRSSSWGVSDAQDLPTLFLAVLGFTWLLSSLLAYWGPRSAALWLLVAFGTLWLVFTIASNVGAEWTGWTSLLLHLLLAVPFFATAWLSKRWPRVAGVLLIVACVFLAQFFGAAESGNLGLTTRAVVAVLFLGPLLASGLALLAVPKNDLIDDDERPSPTNSIGARIAS